jgi:hypothetical protein
MLRRKPSASVDNDETVALDYKNTVEPSLRFGRHDCQTVRIAFQVVDAWNLVGQSCHPAQLLCLAPRRRMWNGRMVFGQNYPIENINL